MKDAHVFACFLVSPFNTYGVCNESGGERQPRITSEIYMTWLAVSPFDLGVV